MRRYLIPALLVFGAAVTACAGDGVPDRKTATTNAPVATFAGGCFWCIESPYEKLDGVLEVVSGYTGGAEKDASYKKVCTGRTGHYEAVRIKYDPSRITYRKLLEVFWRQIDPTDAGGQFTDRGPQYRTAIFHHGETQRRLAETTKAEIARSGRFSGSIVTKVLPAVAFYPAEEHHQDYCLKKPERYESYRVGSGRAGFLSKVWGREKTPREKPFMRPTDEKLKTRLTPLQYRVTREDGTEAPFDNAHWDSKRPGIYVDVVSGEPLFSSTDKFESGTGWPSFTRPLEPDNIVGREDRKLGYVRGEIRSRRADSHLGHVFPDGPKPTGLRYCVNSAALRFVAEAEMEGAGYGQYLHLFRKPRDGEK